MFKFLKDKLKKGIKSISKEIDEEGVSEETEEEKQVEQEEEKKGFFSKLKEKFTKTEDIPEEETKEQKVPIKHEVEEYQKKQEIKKEKKKLEKKEEKIKEKVEEKKAPSIQVLTERKEKREEIKKIEEPKKEEPIEEKKGLFSKIKEKVTTKKINQEQFEKIFWNLEVILLENNVAVEVIEKIKDDLKQEIVDTPLKRGKIEEIIENTLKTSIEQLLKVDSFDFLEKIKEKKPYVICFVGINGSGKTTTIAKIAKLLQNNNISCVLAAADTFRAAAIDQLKIHADKLGVKLIKHDYGSDPAAVAFDAIKYAKSKAIDVVLIDTAGRMHSNLNLMDELKKVKRVAKPDLILFVGESITGNDAVSQSKRFEESINIDGVILTKSDIDEKGGAIVSISYVTQKPILYLGTGQNYEDLEVFDSNKIMVKLGL